MKRLFAATVKSVAKTCSLDRSLRPAAIRPLAQDSNRSAADSWRHALVSADRWAVDASNWIGAVSR